jgi:hypothetical protein
MTPEIIPLSLPQATTALGRLSPFESVQNWFIICAIFPLTVLPVTWLIIKATATTAGAKDE